MLVLGITVLVNPDYILSLLQLQMPSVSTLSAAVDIDKVMTYSGIFLIVFGIVVMIVAALGCYGAISQQKTILIAVSSLRSVSLSAWLSVCLCVCFCMSACLSMCVYRSLIHYKLDIAPFQLSLSIEGL